MAQPVTPEEVKDNLSFTEKVISYFTGRDDYQAAMLHNQKVQTQMLSQMTGVDMANNVDPTNVDMDDLPEGLVGTSEDSISSGDTGRAIFDIGGSKYEARVRAQSDIGESETLVITGGDNDVRPADYAQNALSMMVGSGESGRNAVMRPDSVGIYETDDLESSNSMGSIVLEPGEEAIIASATNGSFGGYLLAVGAYNADGVEYGIIVDGEFVVGGWTSSPLGTLNDPFWFSREMGGVIKFEESAQLAVRYDEGETGQVELTGRVYTQEF